MVGRVDGPKMRTWNEHSMSSARGSIKGFGSANGFRARNRREYSGYKAQPQSGTRAAWKCSKPMERPFLISLAQGSVDVRNQWVTVSIRLH